VVCSAAARVSLGVDARQLSTLRRLGMSAESFDPRSVKKLDGIGMWSLFALASPDPAYTFGTIPPTPAVYPHRQRTLERRIMLGIILARFAL
jgi:hypothetical protein